MIEVTPWMSVATPPLASRPGEYEVRFNAMNCGPTVRMRWDGAKWASNGEYYPREAWGDKWRGCTAPAKG